METVTIVLLGVIILLILARNWGRTSLPEIPPGDGSGWEIRVAASPYWYRMEHTGTWGNPEGITLMFRGYVPASSDAHLTHFDLRIDGVPYSTGLLNDPVDIHDGDYLNLTLRLDLRPDDAFVGVL